MKPFFILLLLLVVSVTINVMLFNMLIDKFKNLITLFLPPIYFKIKYVLKKEDNIGFGSRKPQIRGKGKVMIGRYCSIGDNVVIITSGHNPDRMSTYLFGYTDLTRGWDKVEDAGKHSDVTIGNDVWIGYGSMIVAPATIGDGAIIGAGSVVRGRVKPYSVVAGNPAEFVCMRFGKETVDKLLTLKWWDWKIQRIKGYYQTLNSAITT
jgi:acetyltransferase-like isoleucine patch superfamily enzyme